MIAFAASIGLFLSVTATARSAPQVHQRGLLGDLRLHEFTSRVFQNTRFLRVLVPAGYDDPRNASRRYPVLYLNDGQNLFDSATAVFGGGEWHVDETVQQLIARNELPPLIVVGVDNAGRVGRAREYLPYVDVYLRPAEPDPQGRRFPEFLVDEVVSFIDGHYRTVPDARGRALGGSSYGGLISVYTAIARPGTFGRLLIESPSVYVEERRILREANGAHWPDRVYLGVGTNEGGRAECRADDAREPEAVADVRRLESQLRDAGLDAGRLLVVVESCGTHTATSWGGRLPRALRFLYAP